MKRHRIERLIEGRGLEAVDAADEEVAAIWAAALREWSDSAVPGLSVAGAFTHAYQAALRGATALVRASGYRVRGAVGGNHHDRRRHAERARRPPYRPLRRRRRAGAG